MYDLSNFLFVLKLQTERTDFMAKRCPHCGRDALYCSNFCIFCGKELPEIYYTRNTEVKKHSFSPSFFLMVMGVIFVCFMYFQIIVFNDTTYLSFPFALSSLFFTYKNNRKNDCIFTVAVNIIVLAVSITLLFYQQFI